MNLSESLARGFAPLSLPQLTQPVVLDRAVARLRRRFPDTVEDPPEQERERLVQELRRRLRSGDWKEARLSEVVRAARALFDREWRDRSDLADVRAYMPRNAGRRRRAALCDLFSIFSSRHGRPAPRTRANSLRLSRGPA